jgi:cyclophilin family peptidyl-prolyl cis-trans isomerase
MKSPLAATIGPAAKARLFDIAQLPLPPGMPAPLSRRLTMLRCRAASLLVNGASSDPLLVGCEPEREGAIGQRARVEVLGRRPIRGDRLAQWTMLAGSKHAKVREAALELVGGHAELQEAPREISRAFESESPGIVATAGQLVAAHPDRAGGAPVGKALLAALERPWPPDAIETVGALVEAAGALRLEGAGARMEALCTNANPTLREHAARGLSWLKGSTVPCSASALAAPAAELSHLATTPVRVELSLDSGSLAITLDPSLAPVAVTRFADLARAGFYRGVVVHRVVPGFVVQLGDPDGDGFGGPRKEPLRCETSPIPFEPFDVGVALAGRDTGASQLFVTLGRYPHLDEDYAVIGKASGDWAAVAEGDVIREVRVSP